MEEWTDNDRAKISQDVGNTKRKPKKKRSKRPHILKLDVEGHDYEVIIKY